MPSPSTSSCNCKVVEAGCSSEGCERHQASPRRQFLPLCSCSVIHRHSLPNEVNSLRLYCASNPLLCSESEASECLGLHHLWLCGTCYPDCPARQHPKAIELRPHRSCSALFAIPAAVAKVVLLPDQLAHQFCYRNGTESTLRSAAEPEICYSPALSLSLSPSPPRSLAFSLPPTSAR